MSDQTPHLLSTIYFYLTKGCNLACRHCWLAPKNDPDGTKYPTLPVELFEKIVAEARPLGLNAVKLTGGEPLLHPDFLEILNVVGREGLSLTLETNGVLCSKEYAEAIRGSCDESLVSVSLDGATAETHEHIRGVPGCFEAAVNGIRNLVEVGFRPQVIFSIMKRNVDQVESIVRLAEELGAGSLKYNLVQPTARGKQMRQREETLGISELVSLGRHVETALSASTSLPLFYSHPAAFIPLSALSRRGGSLGVCNIKNILGVLADGTYALCGIGEHIREFAFGHSAKDALSEIWEKHPTLTRIRNDLPDKLTGVCARCVLKKRCKGQCLAQNFYQTGELLADFWFCREAEAAGLFPQSRLMLH